MELFEFTTVLKELVDYYERKEPKPGTTELWFAKVKSIPSKPLKWIIKRIEDEHDAFPRNLPGALWGSFREWQQSNPDLMMTRQYFDCPDCTEGLIWAKLTKNGIPYTYVFRCARCRQDKTQAYPMALLAELKADYEIVPKNPGPYEPKKRSVKALVSGIGQDV